MGRFFDFVRRERLYFLLIVFILSVNALAANADRLFGPEAPDPEASPVAEAAATPGPEEMERVLAGNRELAVIAGLVTLLVLAVIVLGLVIDAVILMFRMSGRAIDIMTLPQAPAVWAITDIGKVAVLFAFFGHIVIIGESLLTPVVPGLENDNFRMVLNSAVLDSLAVVFILHFAAMRCREPLRSLGLSAKNFAANVFYGAAAYAASVPALVGALAIVMFVVSVTKYVPEEQPVVLMFMKESDATFLFFSSVFAAIIGPMAEEVFFRAFMYKALKARLGIIAAAAVTSIVFAALHTNVVGFLPIFMLGLLLVYLYEKTGTLVASMTVHITHNLGMVLFVFFLKQFVR